MAVTVDKKEKTKTVQTTSKVDEILPFEERIVRLRLQKSKEKSFLLSDLIKK